MYRCGQNSEGYKVITYSYYGLICTKLYFLYIRRKFMYYLQTHTFRTSLSMKVWTSWYDEEWCWHNLLQKYRIGNNPLIFWSPLPFGLIWPYTARWISYRLMVGSQVPWLCHSQESAEAWGNKTCNERAVFVCVSDVTLSLYMWFCASERIMEDSRMNFAGKYQEDFSYFNVN